MFREVQEYDTSVIVATMVDDQLAMFQVGEPLGSESTDHDVLHLADEGLTIEELCRAIVADDRAFAVQFAPHRVVIASP